MKEAEAPRYPFRICPALEVQPEYARLRHSQPVYRVTLPFGGAAWLVTRYEDVRFALSDSRFSRAASILPGTPRFFEQPVADGLGYVDPPEHTRLRGLLNRAFTARRVQQFRPRIQQIATELLADPAVEPPSDLNAAFAQPFAGQVVCEFVGVPYADRARFEPLFKAIVSTTSHTVEEIGAAVTQAQNYFSELVARVRDEPADTFFGALVRQSDAETALSDEQLANLGFGAIVAGYETTSSQLCNFAYLLLTHEDQLAKLRSNPDGFPCAIEEMLRYTPLLAYGGNPMVATADVEIAGQLVKAGEVVVPSNNAANRDDRIFAAPERLDLERQHNPHLSFNHGAHFCLGSQLARAELQIGISTLVALRPRLELAVPVEELEWKSGSVIRGLAALPVRW